MNKSVMSIAAFLLVLNSAIGRSQDHGAGSGDKDAGKAPAELPAIYDEKADARQAVADALVRAQRDNKRVLLQWGANWCGWCRLLHGTFKDDREVKDRLSAEYEVVLIDLGRMDHNMDLVKDYGADPAGQGIPFLTVLGSDGKVVKHQETGSLEKPDKEHPGHDPYKVLAFLEKHKSIPQDAQGLLDAALADAKSRNRPVMIEFGAYWCVWCKRLEAWLAQPAMENIMSPRVIPLKIDVDRMKNGKTLQSKFGGEGQGLPFVVFLGPDGSKLADSMGPNGNIGCPATDEEITQFTALLKRAISGLSVEDVATIQSTLKANAPRDEAAAASPNADAVGKP